MALLFMDSFDHYASADLLEKWTATNLQVGSVAITAAAGRRGSAALRVTRSSSRITTVSKTLAPSGATAIVGVALRLSVAPPIAASGVLEIVTGATSQVCVRIGTDMSIQVLRGNALGTVLGTASAPFPINAFAYLELRVLLSTTVGTVDLWLNGVSVLSLTGQNTAASGTAWSAIVLGNTVDGSPTVNAHVDDYDDLYVCDGSGAAPWNTVLGDCRVDPRYPTAEGASSAWAPSAGTDNALLVDEAAPNDDTDYVSSTTTGQTDTHVVQDAPVVGAVLYGVQVNLNLKKGDAGACTVAPVVRHSGVDYPGANLSPGTAYAYGIQVYPTNPGTSAQWTEAGFNAAEFGYRKTG